MKTGRRVSMALIVGVEGKRCQGTVEPAGGVGGVPVIGGEDAFDRVAVERAIMVILDQRFVIPDEAVLERREVEAAGEHKYGERGQRDASPARRRASDACRSIGPNRLGHTIQPRKSWVTTAR